jgi:hypothetical protein
MNISRSHRYKCLIVRNTQFLDKERSQEELNRKRGRRRKEVMGIK